MAYITLKELKEILPEILDQWIDEDDESWEWIFSEIEQKCHVGKRHKGKKQKKAKIRKDLDELTKKVDDVIPKIMEDFDARINAQTKRINELSNKISHLSVNHTAMASRVDHVERDIKAAKLMAQTAKDRTQVDYTKCSKKKKEIPIIKKTCDTCKHLSKQPMDQPCIDCCYNGINISGMDKWEVKDDG